MAPFLFFGLIALWALGFTVVTFGPVIFALVAWIMLSRAARRQARDARESEVIEARIVREAPPQYPPEAYSPPAHFELLLAAKHDIGRIRGAVAAIEDSAIAKQFRDLADIADRVLARLMAEPVKLGLARRFFASYVPRAADLAAGYPRFRKDGNENRRAKLLDVLYRLESAMKQEEKGLSAPEMTRIDADIRILSEDLKGFDPDFTRAPEPILNRVDEIVKSARRKG